MTLDPRLTHGRPVSRDARLTATPIGGGRRSSSSWSAAATVDRARVPTPGADGGGIMSPSTSVADLVGRRFVADVGEHARLGFYWHSARPLEVTR